MKTKQKAPHTQAKGKASAFRLGRAQFAKISAVEGVALSDEMVREFDEFDRNNLSPVERRRAIFSRYAKVSA